MATHLDDLLEWLLNEVVSRGKDGVSFSQWLELIQAFHDGPINQTRGESDGDASFSSGGKPRTDRDFIKNVWKSFTSHPDVLVGEDRRGNDLNLSEIEALLHPAQGPGQSEDSLPESEYGDQLFLDGALDDPSSPSAQLLEQLKSPTAQTLVVERDSSTSTSDDVEVVPTHNSQRLLQSSAPIGRTIGLVVDNLGRNSSNHPNHGPKKDEVIEMPIIYAQHRPESHDGLSVTPHLAEQPRIYVSQERLQKIATSGHGIGHMRVGDSETPTNPAKRRGRPPKVKTNDSPRRRGRPLEAKLLNPAISNSPALSTLQQILPSESYESESFMNFESMPEYKRHRGRQAVKVAVFTSHDESQRAAGVPGVYFDIVELERTGVGRPKKRKIALFKSEKLKSHSWMNDVGDAGVSAITENQPLSAAESTVINSLTRNSVQDQGVVTRKRSRDPEQAANDEPEPKKLLLDAARRFGSSCPAPYKSPYPSSPATSYMSLYVTDSSITTPSMTPSGTFSTLPAVMSRQVSTLLPSIAAKASALTSEYKSPYAPVQHTGAKLSDESSTFKPTVERPLMTEAFQSTKDDQLEAAIKSAAELAIPDIAVRLPSSNGGIAGNLCLSIDKKSLTFKSEKTLADTAPKVIQVSDIIESPETSKIGSETMVLKITTASSTNGEKEIHCFRFLPTEAAFRAASDMRAKIVTTMMLLDLEDNTEIVVPEKPFKCDGCRGAWKNWEGLKYHQTKSKTLCNPNYRLKNESASLGGRDILGLAAAALDVLNGDVMAPVQKPSFLEGSRDVTAVEQQTVKKPTPTIAGVKSVDARSDPEQQRGKDIIVALLDANEQVFPGEEGLWFAFVAASIQKYPDSGLPSYDVCKVALDLLADTGQIRKVQFSFKDKIGLMKMRTLITRHDVDPTSAVVLAMKENIKTMFPGHYVPPGFAPPKVVQSMLQERKIRPEVTDSTNTVHKAASTSQDHNLLREQVAEVVNTAFGDTPSNKITRSGRISRRPQRLQQSILDPSLQSLEDAMNEDDDDSYTEDLSVGNSTPRAFNTTSSDQRRRRRSTTFKTKPQGFNSPGSTKISHDTHHILLPGRVEDSSKRETDSDPSKFKRRKNEIRPVEAASDRKAMWQPTSSYLQGKNGAWNTSTQPRLIRKYAPRTGMPEPITYMQTFNESAWNFRPYGHGVRPIHARPSKRAEGQTAYLTRIQHGFRPVMMPSGEIFIPSTPSDEVADQFLESAVGESGSQSLRSTRQKRKYTRNSSNISKTRDHVAEESIQVAGSATRKRKYTRRTLPAPKAQDETPPPNAKERPVETPNDYSTIPISRTLLAEDENSARRFSILSDYDNFLDDLDQSATHTSNEQGAESTPSDGRLREVEMWDTNQRAPIAQYMMTARRLTALPADLEGIEDLLADHPDLSVEVVVDHQHNVRRRTREGAISTDTEHRLMVAVVVIRTLTGGLDKQIDWVLVSKLFPDLPMNAVSKRWPNLYTKHNQMVERLGTDFQEFFLEAYERGEISPIDYDHLVDYDWNGLVDLVLERIDINPSNTMTHRLPASRSILNQTFTMNNADNNKAWRDDYFGLLPAVYKRLEFAASEQYTMPVSQESTRNLEIDKFTIAKSWARANTLTPSGSYNKEFAAHKLASIGNGIVAAATSALFESKVLMQRNKGRPTPNRGVEITDTFASALRNHLDETHLTQATAFKATLDAKFRAGEVAMVEWTARDGEILAITNLQAHGRITVEPKGVPMNKFGLTGGGYQTKRMDKANLRFDLQILPTPSYIYDDDIPILSALTPEFSPPRGIAGAIPVWYDIAESLIPAMWKKVLCVVLATIAMRPGAVLKELVRIFAPALEEWEMRTLIEWGLRVGALTVLTEGYEGWNVAEWWWVVGGRA